IFSFLAGARSGSTHPGDLGSRMTIELGLERLDSSLDGTSICDVGFLREVLFIGCLRFFKAAEPLVGAREIVKKHRFRMDAIGFLEQANRGSKVALFVPLLALFKEGKGTFFGRHHIRMRRYVMRSLLGIHPAARTQCKDKYSEGLHR